MLKNLLNILFFTYFLLSTNLAFAYIRDSETENLIEEIANPIFKVANINKDNVEIFIINSNELNAFVTAGMKMYIHSGLIMQDKDPNMLTGVIAHETGHIAAGHIVRGYEAIEQAKLSMNIGYILGLAAAALGSIDAGYAIAAGATNVAERTYLKQSREYESSADQAAIKYLDKLNISARGITDFFDVLSNYQKTYYANKVNPYLQTHPLSDERKKSFENQLALSKAKDNKTPKELQQRFERVVVKLKSFLTDPQKILEDYPESNLSDIARYARSIAYHRLYQYDKSIAEIDYLISKKPRDPYLIELKGQFLYEQSRLDEAIKYYKQAYSLLNYKDNLIAIQIASCLISGENNKNYNEAISLLEKALSSKKESDNLTAWHLLAIAYGRTNNIALSNLALAEYNLLMGKYEEAIRFAELAEKKLDKNTSAYLRSQDIIKLAKESNKKK